MKSFDVMRRQLAEAWFSYRGAVRKAYSQCGEDMILDFAFRALGVPKPTYLDIGAHHPRYLSNTAFFYQAGCRGINIEPDPALFEVIQKGRPHDTNLNVGISDEDGLLDFYVMTVPELNTFSKEEVRKIEADGSVRVRSTRRIVVRSINGILREHFPTAGPDLLSLDVEGMDLQILRAIDYQRHAPLAICVETIEYQPGGLGGKRVDITDFLHSAGYFAYADTYINTIFFDKRRFPTR